MQSNIVNRKLIHFYSSRQLLLILIIALGISLRLFLYLSNHSLWLDECMLTLNIINRSFVQLFYPLDYNQGAPIGFLLIEKLVTIVLGTSEYALRLVPFFCGIVSIFLFLKLAQKYLSQRSVPIALFLFAVLPALVNYSSEVKQYSSDVMVLLIMTGLIIHYQSKKPTVLQLGILGGGGAIAIWFSHPAVFVIGGVGITWAIFAVRNRDWPSIIRFAIVSSIWLLSFLIYYWISLDQLSNNKALLNYWREGVIPRPIISFYSLWWIINKTLSFFGNLEGLTLFPCIALVMFLLGSIGMVLQNSFIFFSLISPICLVLIAAGLHKYPFQDRLILFTIPAFLILIVKGLEAIPSKKSRSRYWLVLKIVVICTLLFPPMWLASRRMGKNFNQEEVKPILKYLRKNWQYGDRLYLHYYSWFPFKYYCHRYDFTENDCIKGLPPWGDYAESHRNHINKLRGQPRVWFLFSHFIPKGWRGKKRKDKIFYLSHLDNLGKRLQVYNTAGAALYLYNLSEVEKEFSPDIE